MFQASEHFIALNKANLDATARFAGIALEGAERILDIHIKAAEGALADGVTQIKALADAKDLNAFAQPKTAFQQPDFEKAASYVKSMHDAAGAMRAELSALVEDQVGEFNKHVVAELDKMAKMAPAGSQVAVAAMKSAVSAANVAYDNLANTVKQFAEIAHLNSEAANQAAQSVKRKTA